MAYKMKGSKFYGKGNQSPAKQLKEEYTRTPQEKSFYESSESKDFEPEPSGTYRGIGSYSKNKKTGDVVTKGVAGSKPKKKVATSEKVGPVESKEMLQKKRGTRKKAEDKDYFSKEASDASEAVIDARKYEKRK